MRLPIFPISGLIRSLRSIFYDRIGYLQYCTWATTYICQACSVKVFYKLELYADLVTARYYKRRMQSCLLLTILHWNIIVQFVVGKNGTTKKNATNSNIACLFSVQKYSIERYKFKKKVIFEYRKFEASWRKVEENKIRLSIHAQN